MRFSQSINENIPASYIGDPSKLLFRYSGNINRSFSVGLSGEKDPGEKFVFASGRYGFDFYTGYIQYRSNKILNKCILGDYSVSTGQGLVSWTGMSLTSASTPPSLIRSGQGIKPSTSTDENNYLRGLATELSFKHFKANLWISYHKRDGKLQYDSLTKEESIVTLLTSGYHSLINTESGYHTFSESYSGINLGYRSQNYNAGCTVTHLAYSIPWIKNYQSYSRFDFRGSELNNAGAYYKTTYRNITIFGEFASSFNKNFAMITGIVISGRKDFSVGILHHSYDLQYHSLKGNAFGENTLPANENGTTLSLSAKPLRSVQLSTYVSLTRFPFQKYRVSTPSFANRLGINAVWTISKKQSLDFRYYLKKSTRDNSDLEGTLKITSPLMIQKFKIGFKNIFNELTEFSMRLDYGSGYSANQRLQPSAVASADLKLKSIIKNLMLSFHYSVYQCEEYDLRMYIYETDVPGAFSLPMYYGKGVRYCITVKLRIAKTDLSFRFSRDITLGKDLDSKPGVTNEIKLQSVFNF